MKSKLIRNLKKGEEFQLRDGTRYPTQIIRARATGDANETEPGFMTRRRRWVVQFEIVSTSDDRPNYTWRSILGYSGDRIDVYEREEVSS